MQFIPAFRWLLAALLALAALPVSAASTDLNLLVEHRISELGADGITRTMQFQERYYRRAQLVWIERVIPEGAHDAKEHAKGGHNHKHLDVAAAARWMVRDKDGKLTVRLVAEHDRVIINVPEAEYGNIGFDGSWDNAWHLLTPKQLQTMKPEGNGKQGLKIYVSAAAGNSLRVTWDPQAEIPRRVESVSRNGRMRKIMTATEVAPPKALPWQSLNGFREKEYSDYLD